MKFIFVIGVEGAGHDMLRALLQPAISQPGFVLEGKWRSMLVEYWDSYPRYKKDFSQKIESGCGNPYIQQIIKYQKVNKTIANLKNPKP